FPVHGAQVTALRDLDLQVRRGGVTGLSGPDGAGKTTLMRLIAGLLTPDVGQLGVLGLDATKQAEALRGRVGYMPQRFGLYEDLSVQQNLALYADLYGLPEAQRASRFSALMEFTGLGPFRSRLAGQLSGGMKQKLGLACTLIHPPELLLLDEPSVGVDPISRRELWKIVQLLTGERMTVIWSTAYLDEAERCDDALLLYEGRLVAQAAPEQLIEPMRGRTFAMPVPPADRRRAARAAKAIPGVIDAVIQGTAVRVLVAEGGQAPDPRAFLPRAEGAPERMSPAEPHLEDAFIALLRLQTDADAARSPIASKPPAAASPVVAGHTGEALGEDPVIRIRSLTRVFGDFTAVDGVSFDVLRGEIFGLLGPNGAGKSTTFKMLCGLLPPSSGEARVLGIDLRRSAPEARARIGYMSQKFSLYGILSIQQNLQFFGAAYGLAGAHRARRIAATIADFGLGEVADRTSDDLPLGFKQRLALGAALLHEPEILFLDEPTSGVDPLTRREFWDRINALAEAGVTVMVTTHFLDEAEYCDRIGIIYKGGLIALGSPNELKSRYRTPDLPEPSLDDAFVAMIEAKDEELHP
ncbi:MAG: ATP-binding cassette domain-containing protein, partial [Polyangiales bacterium]